MTLTTVTDAWAANKKRGRLRYQVGSCEFDVDSIAASVSRIRVCSETVRETPKSHYSRRTRRDARSVS